MLFFQNNQITAYFGAYNVEAPLKVFDIFVSVVFLPIFIGKIINFIKAGDYRRHIF